MKKLLSLVFILTLLSCSQDQSMKLIDQEIISGKVSAITLSRYGPYNTLIVSPKIYIQSPTATREVEIPSDFEGRWKVGDTCLLIVERYVVDTTKK